MERALFAGLLSLSILFVGKAHGQVTAQGDVVIHSDDRLAVLLRKNHTYVKLITPEVIRKELVLAPPPPAANTYTAPSGLVHHDLKTVYTGKGYRVQIYNGPSREKAMAVKTEFMRRFPGVRTYLIFLAPAFRVKIGDYRIRGDAEGMLREANSMFSPSMIVPDMVTISTY